MKSFHDSTQMQEGPTPAQIASWSLALRQWEIRLAPFFARPEALQHALLYLHALLSDIPRKNGWQIAEHARQLRPSGMQRLLSRAVWDQDAVRRDAPLRLPDLTPRWLHTRFGRLTLSSGDPR